MKKKEDLKYISLELNPSVFRIMKQRKNRLRKFMDYDELSWNKYFEIISFCFIDQIVWGQGLNKKDKVELKKKTLRKLLKYLDKE